MPGRVTLLGILELCRCGPSASTSRAARTPTATRSASATSTSRPTRPGAAPSTAPRYERRLADAAWTYGSLTTPPTPAEPPGLDDGSAAAVLDEAEEILNSAGARIKAEVEVEQEQASRKRGLKRPLPPQALSLTGT